MSFNLVLDASLPHLSIDPRLHLDNKMSLHTYTTYVKHILGHTSYLSIVPKHAQKEGV